MSCRRETSRAPYPVHLPLFGSSWFPSSWCLPGGLGTRCSSACLFSFSPGDSRTKLVWWYFWLPILFIPIFFQSALFLPRGWCCWFCLASTPSGFSEGSCRCKSALCWRWLLSSSMSRHHRAKLTLHLSWKSWSWCFGDNSLDFQTVWSWSWNLYLYPRKNPKPEGRILIFYMCFGFMVVPHVFAMSEHIYSEV